MFTRIRKKIKGIWNHQSRISFYPKIRGKYLFFKTKEENYISNGACLLEESISLFHGKANPFRHFSVNELNNMKLKRVPNFYIGLRRIYQGSWDGRVVYVSKCEKTASKIGCEEYIREIVVGTQMATHNNSHKVLGCCLETIYPTLVYEWVAPKTVEDCIIPKNEKDESESVLEWKDRLRIAWEISHCVSYLHTAFPRPIIHRSVNPKNVFLDIDNSAKLSDYSLSISIPEGEEFVMTDEVYGYFGYLDKEAILQGLVRESTDVYSFGILLLVLLSGKKAYETSEDYQSTLSLLDLARDCIKNKCISEIIDPLLTTNGVTTFEEFQIKTTVHLALSCTLDRQEERPTMEEVAIQLKNMITSPESISLSDGHQ